MHKTQNSKLLNIVKLLIERKKLPHFILVRANRSAEFEKEIYDAAQLLLGTHVFAPAFTLGANMYNPDFFEIKKDPIAIADIRLLKEKVFFKPGGERKVFVVHNIERASRAAQSALLKIAEEAPENSVLVATTIALHALQPALVSRAFILKLPTKETENFPPSSKEGLIGSAIASTRTKMLEKIRANANPLKDVCALERLVELLRQSEYPVLTAKQASELTNAFL